MKKILEGIVVSLKMQKTVVVAVTRKRPHPLYKKIIARRKYYKADFSDFSLKIGDRVKIVETRPISKEKHFKILEIITL